MLFDSYTRLVERVPVTNAHLYGSPVDGEGKLWLAITDQSFPCLLFSNQEAEFRTDIALRFVDVEFSRECEIASEAAGPTVGVYTIVRLNENDSDMVRLFLRLLEEAFCRELRNLSNRQIGDRILEIAELFRRLESSTGDVLGLWGELYIIAGSGNIATAARCWCSHKNAKYDFVCPDFVLDVKTTLKPRRQHRFSIEQLRPVGGYHAYIASLQLVEAPSGLTVSDLLESVLAALGEDEVRGRFVNQCLLKGGRDLYRSVLTLQALPEGRSLAVFDASEIPVPAIEPMAPITNVRFDVDLSGSVAVSEDRQRQLLAFHDTPKEPA